AGSPGPGTAPATGRAERWLVAQTGHRWRRRAAAGVAVLVVTPVLFVAVLWPLTPSVANAQALVHANLNAAHDAELVVLPQPARVAQALIATEDSRFFMTPGIDPVSAAREGITALTGGGDAGAATLEQQLAKNLYFPQGVGLVSKVQEAELSLKLDASYSKSDILRMYLADVYFRSEERR